MNFLLNAGVDFTGVTLPFTSTDLLTSAMGLVGLLGTFILLGIVIGFAPRLIAVIKGAVGQGGRK